MRAVLAALRPAAVLLGLFTLLYGVLYTGAVTGIAQLAFPSKANGSLWRDADGKPLGSALIGQEFVDPAHLWGRPSATVPAYDPSAAHGSDYSVGNPKLLDRIDQRLAQLRQADPTNLTTVPVDLVTASASGVDPHISFAAADYQVARIAAARGITPDQVRQAIAPCASNRLFGIVGEPVINVLCVNLRLDGRKE